MEKKLEFLRGKLSSSEIDEVLSRLQEEDFTNPVENRPVQSKSKKPSVFGMIGAAILGAFGASFVIGSKSKPEKKHKLGESHSDTDLRRPSLLQQNEKNNIEELIAKQTESLDKMNTQLVNLQITVEKLSEDTPLPADVLPSFTEQYSSPQEKERALKALRALLYEGNKDINIQHPTYQNVLASNPLIGEVLRSAGFSFVKNSWQFRYVHRDRFKKLTEAIDRAMNV